MKAPRESKTRLSEVMDESTREALSLYLLKHVIRTVKNSSSSPEIWIVGGDSLVKSLAQEESIIWVNDHKSNLNDGISLGLVKAFEMDASAILVLPSDLGLLKPRDVDYLIKLSNGLNRLVIAGAERDGGTNALLIPKGLLIGPHFGPESFNRHKQSIKTKGFQVAIAKSPGISFDLDTPEDLLHYHNLNSDLYLDLNAIKIKMSGPPGNIPIRSNTK